MNWWQRLWRRAELDRQLDAELRDHVERLTADYVAAGMPEGEARRRARIEFGGLEQVKEGSRDVRGTRFVEDLARDVRLAVRTCRRAPVFSFVCVLTLALGIGVNTALFTITRGVLFATLPVERPEELVEVACFRVGAEGYDPCHTSYPGFQTYLKEQRALSGLFGYWSAGDLNANIDGNAEIVRGLLMSGGAYGALGLQPQVGRLLDVGDDDPSAPIVAVLSDQYWQRRFGRDPNVVGRTIRLNGHVVTIVGVTPASFRGVSLDHAPDVTLPLSTAEVFRRPGSLTAGAAWWIGIMGRLAPGVSLERAQTELAPIYHRTLEQTLALLPPEEAGGFQQFVEGFRFRLRWADGGTDSYLRGSLDRPLQVLSGVVVLVLLIACANLTGLLLSRAVERRKEFAIRLALGAGPWRLALQVLVESVVLAALGGALGLVLASWVGPGVLTLAAGERALRAVDLGPDVTVLVFASLVSVGCGVFVGLAAVARARQTAPQEAWQSAGASPTVGWSARLLIGIQVAVALVLVTSALLFIRSLANVRSLDPGFDADRIVTLTVAPGLAGYASPERLAYLERATASLNGLPGVASATFVARPMAVGLVSQTGIGVPGFEVAKLEDAITGQNRVGAQFVETLGLRLVDGRDFRPSDRTTSSSVAVVNESFATHFFRTTDVVGRQFLLPWGDTASIIGIVRDARDRSLAMPPERFMYLPFVPNDVGPSARILVRANGEVAPLLGSLPQALASIDRAVPVYDVQPLRTQLDGTLGTRRLLALLGQLFGGLALLLVAVGLYGLLSGLVTRRTREIGVRMACGAGRTRIGWLFTREVLMVLVSGLAVGLVAAVWASQFLRGQLFGVAPTDPWATAMAVGALLAAGTCAVWVPTRRAIRVDPVVTLRYE